MSEEGLPLSKVSSNLDGPYLGPPPLAEMLGCFIPWILFWVVAGIFCMIMDYFQVGIK